MKNLTEIKTTLIGIALFYFGLQKYNNIESHNEVEVFSFQAIVIYCFFFFGLVAVFAKDKHIDVIFELFKNIFEIIKNVTTKK